MKLPDHLVSLGLTAHPEGGFFRETHRSPLCTVIDFVLLAGQVSRWHRVLGAEEVWMHHKGAPLDLHLFDGTAHERIRLGLSRATAVVPADVWQAAEPLVDHSEHDYTWVSCVVTPPFTFDRFELGTRDGPHIHGLERFGLR
jgi:predicted cupin superfamily sugar epimerase